MVKHSKKPNIANCNQEKLKFIPPAQNTSKDFLTVLDELDCSGGMSLLKNEHLSCYQSVSEYLFECDLDEFLNLEDYQICCNNNVLYELIVYPNTPIGSYCIRASSFEKLFDKLKELSND